MTSTRKTDFTIRIFAPEEWGQVHRFAKFHACSFPDASPIERRAVSGIEGHFQKAIVLKRLATRLAPSLELDRKQLDDKGYTSADHAVELAAVVESFFTEIYSTIDCARQVLTACYPIQGMSKTTKKSTRSTFTRIRNGDFDNVLPPELLIAFNEANWYNSLLKLRDELTHSDIGSVHQNEETGKVFYMHAGLGSVEKALIIEDIFDRMDADTNSVNIFLGRIFHYLNTLVKDNPTQQVCGIHQGKILLREIRPEPTVTFNSGKCLSMAWIEVDGKPTCPLLCGAYWNAKAEMQRTVPTDPA